MDSSIIEARLLPSILLEPSLSRGKFTEVQCHFTMFPYQDTPGVKFSYTAEVKAVKDLQVFMSAIKMGEGHEDSNHKVHKFEQKS